MRSAAAALRGVTVAAALVYGLASCLSAPIDSTGSLGESGPAGQQPTPTAEQQSAQFAIDTFNAAAGGPVSAQQRALAGLLDDGQRSVQSRCAAAATTLELQPVYARLAAAPGWKPSSGTLSGTVYSLPTLVRIWTGNRITGTDLTDLHIAVADGRARLPALCPS